jgi:lysophospholipase L1-like esterase
VSAGFGMAPGERHTAVFYEKLKENGRIDEYKNLAVNGYTTAKLLELLESMSENAKANENGNEAPEDENPAETETVNEPDIFKNAHVITLNIGGNNLLYPFLDYMPNLEEIADIIFGVRDFAAESGDIVDEMKTLISGVRDIAEDFTIFDVLRVTAFVREAAPVLDEVIDMFNKVKALELVNVISLLSGNFPAELEAALQQGVKDFSAEFKQIIKWLGENAPDAVIIVNTVYNPIPREILGLSLEISEKADMFTSSLNEIILEEMKSGKFLVSDIHSGFANESGSMTNLYLDKSSMILSFDIIHPNAEGHKLIAELNYKSFEAYMAEKEPAEEE